MRIKIIKMYDNRIVVLLQRFQSLKLNFSQLAVGFDFI